jgi:hypothetical protein
VPHPCATRPPRDLPAVARQLDAIAEEAGWGGPPLLLGLTDDGPDEAPAALPPYGPEPDDLVASLIGFVAPPGWRALAVIVHGRSWALDDRSAEPRPIRLVHVVDRLGATASVLRVQGDERASPVPVLEGGHGRLVDACHRAMGLATPPPPADSTELWAAMWLDRLLADAARGEPATDVRTAARTHPAVELFAAHEPALADAAVARLARLGHLMGRAKPWPDLRQRAIAGEWVVEGLAPAGAEWMDDGMFARWLLGTFPAVEDLAAELDLLLPERVAKMVRATLAEWEIA